jgi:hypothetical protein
MRSNTHLFILMIGLSQIFQAQGQTSPLEDPALNPWITPLDQCDKNGNHNKLDINMGFLNTDYFCKIDPEKGVIFLTKNRQPTNRDAARLVLEKINPCQSFDSERILIGVSRDSLNQLQNLLPNRPPNTTLRIGKNNGKWSPPETHAKVFQLGNGVDRFFTVHGSLNIQTVGLTCKANNALRFTETKPVLYNYFKELGDAVEVNSAKGKFNGLGNENSSGTGLIPASIGNYHVQFYAGRGTGFVGGSVAEQKPWPKNINPPFADQHANGVINWYDGLIYDAAKQLKQGRDVNLDVLIFEVGQENAFISNLWRFVQNGFEGGKTEDKTSAENLPSSFIGTLSVRFLWQFQSGSQRSGKTFTLLNGPNLIQSSDNPQGAPSYSLEKARIWPILDKAGIALNPGTPRDMHNKLAILAVKNYPEENKIYVTSSNMDAPGIGSGKLWQAGTTISLNPQSKAKDSKNSESYGLWNSYRQYFELLWSNREGQENAGQLGFSELINKKRLTGVVNWIETIPVKSARSQEPKEGIDAYFFPIPFE